MLRFLKLVLVVLVLLGLGLAVGWMLLAHRLDAEIDRFETASAARGTQVTCDQRDVSGFPLALQVECGSLTIASPRFRVNSGRTAIEAPLHRPGHGDLSFEGPLDLDRQGMPRLVVDWDGARASFDAWTDGLKAASLALAGPHVARAGAAQGLPPLARAERADAHLDGQGPDLIVMGAVEQLVLGRDERATPPFDLAAELFVKDGSGLLGARAGGGRLRGHSGTIRLARLALAGSDGAIEISGPFQVSEAGLLSAMFELRLHHPATIASAIEGSLPKAADIISNLAAAIQLAGNSAGDVIALPITVRDGVAAMGLLPLGRIPPLG